MLRSTTPGWLRAVAAMVVVALSMAGLWRPAPAIAAPFDLVPGFNAPICHSGGDGAPADPAAPPHDCCDACALLAPAVLPSPPRPA